MEAPALLGMAGKPQAVTLPLGAGRQVLARARSGVGSLDGQLAKRDVHVAGGLMAAVDSEEAVDAGCESANLVSGEHGEPTDIGHDLRAAT